MKVSLGTIIVIVLIGVFSAFISGCKRGEIVKLDPV